MSKAERLAIGSVAIGIIVLAMKLWAWSVTGSAALFSDAAETVVNVAAAFVAFLALRLAAKPADANHPYGHDKAEFFAAVIEGGLIVAASMVILHEAWTAYWNPRPILQAGFGAALNAAATAINLVWATFLRWRGKQLRSPALLADAQHIYSDVVTALGALTGVGLVLLTGLPWLDPLVAAIIAVYVLASGGVVIASSVSGLMDAAPSPAVVARIRQLVAEHAEGAIEAHDLRTRHAGRLTFLEFHLVVPGAMTVAAAHEICDRVEAALKAEMEGLMITIHVEPEGKAKHLGVLVL